MDDAEMNESYQDKSVDWRNFIKSAMEVNQIW
jgi:hypothetical protein